MTVRVDLDKVHIRPIVIHRPVPQTWNCRIDHVSDRSTSLRVGRLTPARAELLREGFEWHWRTAVRLRERLEEAWLAPLLAIEHDILNFDFRTALAEAGHVLVF